MSKFNYFYKTQNLINGNFYYGVHKTNNLEDNYLGSGNRILYAIKKYGKENFKKEILMFFETYEEALNHESKVVTEKLITDTSCYNLALGGKSDTRFLRQGPSLKNKTTGEIINPKSINEFNELFNTGLYTGLAKNKILVKDKNENIFMIDKNDLRYKNGELVSFMKNKIVVKDLNENIFMIDKNDLRYKNGELVSIHKGVKKTKEHKKKIGLANSISQRGERNSQYGTKWFWIYNPILKQNKKIKRELIDEYEIKGWKKGRIFKW
jgi:hypothetical protein